MRRGSLAALLLTCFALPQPAASQGSYAVGSIAITRRGNQNIDSSAAVECFNFLGHADPQCQLAGDHYIYDTEDGGWLAGESYVSAGEYIGYIRNTGTAGQCYRARVTVSIYGSSYTNQWGSNQACLPADSPPPDGCPILLDLDQNGFHLSGPEEPAWFDLDADGAPEALAWTSAGEEDAFLCRDLNANGVIDDGGELFGWATRLLSGERAQIGYAALAELDDLQLGGNGDGLIDAADAVFGELCVWVDTNRDGVSQSAEIRPLAQTAITALEYTYRTVERRDAHGNLLRYQARAWSSNSQEKLRPVSTYDVIFAQP